MLHRLLTVSACVCLCLTIAVGCGDKSTGGNQPGFWAKYIGSYAHVFKSKACDATVWSTGTANGVICDDGPPFTVETPGFTQDTMITFEGKTASGQDSVDVIVRGKVRQGIMCQGALEYHTWMKPEVNSAWTQFVEVTLAYTNPACTQYNFCYVFELERTRTGDAPDPCDPSAKRNAFPDEVVRLITAPQ